MTQVISNFLNIFVYFNPKLQNHLNVAKQIEALCLHVEPDILSKLSETWYADKPIESEHPDSELELHPNVKAFLLAVRYHESSINDDAFTMRFPGKTFEGFDKHPEILDCLNAGTADELCSDAAGAFQFISTTWNIVKEQANLPDFSPTSQTIGAIQLIKNRGVYNNLIAGDLLTVLDACSYEWASLPDSTGNGRYGQTLETVDGEISLFKRFGGTLM